MDAVADLGTEHVVHKLVLGDSAESGECGRTDRCLEVMTVAGHLRLGIVNARLDPCFQLLRGN